MAQDGWGLTPEVVLLFVVVVQVVVLVFQVFVLVFQVWAVRQQTRVSVLDKRVELFEAAKDCVRQSGRAAGLR